MYRFSVWWRFSSENFVEGIIKADSKEEADAKIQKTYSGFLGYSVFELELDEDGICEVYSK